MTRHFFSMIPNNSEKPVVSSKCYVTTPWFSLCYFNACLCFRFSTKLRQNYDNVTTKLWQNWVDENPKLFKRPPKGISLSLGYRNCFKGYQFDAIWNSFKHFEMLQMCFKFAWHPFICRWPCLEYNLLWHIITYCNICLSRVTNLTWFWIDSKGLYINR